MGLSERLRERSSSEQGLEARVLLIGGYSHNGGLFFLFQPVEENVGCGAGEIWTVECVR